MKKFLICFIVIVACKTREKITYDLPPGMSLSDTKYVMDDLETGRILYKDHCSTCHGIFGKAKPGVPDFSVYRVDNNLEKRMRWAVTKDPISHKITFEMMPEEVNQAMGFIQRVHKNN
jgi:hypothetical protein